MAMAVTVLVSKYKRTEMSIELHSLHTLLATERLPFLEIQVVEVAVLSFLD